MKIVLDMNPSPSWAEFLTNSGFMAVHWSSIGLSSAPDREIMAWANAHDYIVIRCDLDFGTILAVSGGEKPSVIQIRSDNLSPAAIGGIVALALKQFEEELRSGALLTLDTDKQRVRLLPLTN